MDDQRIEARPALGREDLGYSFVLCRIGAEPIDGLGREGDELAFDQGLGGTGNGLGQMSFLVAISGGPL
jgi:hypothetical protein